MSRIAATSDRRDAEAVHGQLPDSPGGPGPERQEGGPRGLQLGGPQQADARPGSFGSSLAAALC